MAHCKREGNNQDEDSLAKKLKVDNFEAESDRGNDRRPDVNTLVSVDKEPVSGEANGQKEIVDEQVNSQTQKKYCQLHEQKVVTLGEQEVLIQQAGGLSDIKADAAEDKGSRHSMEDAWVVLPDARLEFPGKLRCAHFAIYDGHGGRLAAEFAQKNLHSNVLSAGLPRELMDIKAAKRAILEGFRRTDESLLQESSKGNWQDGATAVCVWVLEQTVLVANVGDAKAVLARFADRSQCEVESTLKAIVLTREHKAIYPQERARIQKAGGTVGPNGRLQGRLEVSRAFGDRQFKKVGVVATPDIHSFELTKREQFIILGCDGLWGVFGPSDAVDFVHKQLKEKSSATTAARRLVREAVRERRCKDNCTAIVIVFKHK